MKQKIILFDIDYTLFDAKFYRDQFVLALKSALHYSGENFSQLADQAYISSKEKAGYFDPEIFIDELVKLAETTIPKQTLVHIIQNQETITSALYKDVFPVLEKLSKDKNLILGIFSAGKIAIQRPKINLLEHVLDANHIHIYEFHKRHALPELMELYKHNQVYLIDDIAQILEQAKKLNPQIKTVLIQRKSEEKRPEELANFTPEYIISSLEEIIPIFYKE